MEFILENLRTIILSVSAVIALFLIIKNFAKIRTFLSEVRAELTKVSWSTRQELRGATIVVITLTALMAVFIGAVDLFLSQVLSLLFR